MKSDKKQVFADIVYFDLVYHSEKKRENSNRGQKMSAKVCQRFLYSLPPLVNVLKTLVSVSKKNLSFGMHTNMSSQLEFSTKYEAYQDDTEKVFLQIMGVVA